MATFNSLYWPPLVNDLFRRNAPFDAILNVGPSVEAERRFVVSQLAAHGDRRQITRIAAESVNALVDLRSAARDADAIRVKADAMQFEQRQRMATVTTIEQTELVNGVVDDLRALNVPLLDLNDAIAEHRLRSALIEEMCLRRVHSCHVLAIESQVAEITGQLQRLKAATDAVHAKANAPDEIITAILAVQELLGVPTMPDVPTVTWPKWSSIGNASGKSKGAWTGDPFAPLELKAPDHPDDFVSDPRPPSRARNGGRGACGRTRGMEHAVKASAAMISRTYGQF
jgi:hypothetical protein